MHDRSPSAKGVLFFLLSVLQQHLATAISRMMDSFLEGAWQTTALVRIECKQEKPNSSNESKQH